MIPVGDYDLRIGYAKPYPIPQLIESGIEVMAPIEQDKLKELQDYTISTPEGQKHINSLKPFLIEYWDRVQPLDLKNTFLSLALSTEVLATVAGYLGCWPRLYDLRLWETKVTEPGVDKVYSQMWHRDPEDKQLLNLFVYLNDVDEDTGPFTYIPGSHRFGPFWKKFPQILPPRASYPGDVKVETYFKMGEIKTYTAPAGTIIFADTAGLHKGGYCTKKPRLMFKSLYVTDGNFYNTKHLYKLPPVLPSGLTDQQLYALGVL